MKPNIVFVVKFLQWRESETSFCTNQDLHHLVTSS
jgi:hypothetical protein